MNFDPKEIAKFEALAHRWWDPEGDFKPLHDINAARIDYIGEKVALAGAKVLDVGCGGGILSEAMAARGAEVTGIDMAESPLAVARLHALDGNVDNVQYEQATPEDFATQAAGQFQLVTCLEMLEHVPDVDSTLCALAKLCAPGGDVVLSTINRNPKAYALAIVGAEYLLELLPRGTHEYSKFIRPSELARGVRNAGLTVVEVTGMRYNPFTRRVSLGSDVDVNYLLHARKHRAADA